MPADKKWTIEDIGLTNSELFRLHAAAKKSLNHPGVFVQLPADVMRKVQGHAFQVYFGKLEKIQTHEFRDRPSSASQPVPDVG